LNEGVYAATGSGAWHYRGEAEPVRAQVSTVTELSKSVFVTSGMESFLERGIPEKFAELSRQVEFGRTWGDVYGYMLVATGRAEVMLDPCLSIWDAAAVQPIIEEAGGRFSDWENQPTYDSGDAIGSNGLVHDELLRCLHR